MHPSSSLKNFLLESLSVRSRKTIQTIDESFLSKLLNQISMSRLDELHTFPSLSHSLRIYFRDLYYLMPFEKRWESYYVILIFVGVDCNNRTLTFSSLFDFARFLSEFS